MHENSNKSTRIGSLNIAGGLASKISEGTIVEFVKKRLDIVFFAETKSKGHWKFGDWKSYKKDRFLQKPGTQVFKV